MSKNCVFVLLRLETYKIQMRIKDKSPHRPPEHILALTPTKTSLNGALIEIHSRQGSRWPGGRFHDPACIIPLSSSRFHHLALRAAGHHVMRDGGAFLWFRNMYCERLCKGLCEGLCERFCYGPVLR